MTNTNIYVVGGEKGGVGKALLSLAIVDAIESNGNETAIFDGCTNCDIKAAFVKTHGNRISNGNLDDSQGWEKLLTLGVERSRIPLVVNTGARAERYVERYGSQLEFLGEEMGRKITTFWILQPGLDGLRNLKRFMELFPGGRIVPVINPKVATADCYPEYNNETCKTKKAAEASSGVGTIEMPMLNPDVSRMLVETAHLSIASALMPGSGLSAGQQLQLRKFRRDISIMLAPVLKT